MALSLSPEAIARHSCSGSGAPPPPPSAVRRRRSAAPIIATISSYPRSAAITSGVVASRWGYTPFLALAPCSISVRTMTLSRRRTAYRRAELFTSSGRCFSIARSLAISPDRAASSNRLTVTPPTKAFNLGQLPKPYARASTSCASCNANVDGPASLQCVSTSATVAAFPKMNASSSSFASCSS